MIVFPKDGHPQASIMQLSPQSPRSKEIDLVHFETPIAIDGATDLSFHLRFALTIVLITLASIGAMVN